jgi:hypothetical protein
MHQFNPAELPMLLFSEKNPLMKQVAEWAEQVRENRQPVAKDNPLVAMQAQFSDAMVQALEQFGKIKDRSYEQMFLGIYSSPLIQAMLGLRAGDEPPRRHPGTEPERLAFIQQRIEEIKARIAEGGALEAGIRSLVYIGMAGPGADERAFNVLRQIRGSHGHLTLEQFKQTLREQFFALLLDREAALAAIPEMLPAEAAARMKMLDTIRRVVTAAGEPDDERARRLVQVEKLFAGATATGKRTKRGTAAPRTRPATTRPARSKRRSARAPARRDRT